MKRLGKGKEVQPIIESQLSQLMVELEAVHNDDIRRVLAKDTNS